MIHLDKIRQFSNSMPDRAAAVSGHSELSWQQFQELTEARLHFLLTQFCGRLPTQACIVSHNELNLLPWMAALATLGIPVTGLDYTLPADALHSLAIQLGADFLLVSSSARGGSGAALDFGPMSAVRFDLDSVTFAYADKVRAKPVENLLETAGAPRAFRSVGLTSGTSGAPKPVIRSRSFDQRRFKYFTDRHGFNRHDRFLVSMPLYHAAGNGWARMFMTLGATLFLVPINAPDELTAAIRKHGITASVMTPSVLDQVVDLLEPEAGSSKLALRWLLVGGKHFPAPQKMRAIECLGDVVYEYYGTTETGVNTIAEPHDLRTCPESVGRPIEGNDIAVVDEKGCRLAPYAVGTVAVASYMNMDHYGNGSANDLILDGERYLLTPDQGYVDLEGRLFLVNRSDIWGNSAPLYRLEDAIRSLPCVADVALLQGDDFKINCALVIRGKTPTHLIHERVHSLASTQQLFVTDCRDVPRIPYSPTGKVRIGELASFFSNPSS